MNKRTLIALATTMVFTLPALAQTKAPIRVGAVLSTTGPAAYLGDPQLKTLQTYIAQLNTEGGVLGRKLELVHYDDASEAGKANGFAKRLMDDDKVDLLIEMLEASTLVLLTHAGKLTEDTAKDWVTKSFR